MVSCLVARELSLAGLTRLPLAPLASVSKQRLLVSFNGCNKFYYNYQHIPSVGNICKGFIRSSLNVAHPLKKGFNYTAAL